MDSISDIKTYLIQQEALKAQAIKDLELNKQFVEKLQNSQEQHDKARRFILAFSKNMRQQVKGLIDHIVTMAIQAVFDDSIKFVTEINEDKSEVSFSLEKDGKPHPIIDFVGEGLVDVISFALRVCILLLSRRPKIMILDEPFKFLNKARHPAASELVTRLSSELGIQFLIITHSEALMDGGDKVFQVELRKTKHGNISRVTEL